MYNSGPVVPIKFPYFKLILMEHYIYFQTMHAEDTKAYEYLSQWGVVLNKQNKPRK